MARSVLGGARRSGRRLRRPQGRQGGARPTRRRRRHGLSDFGDGLRELAAAVREGMAEREGELRLALGIDTGTADARGRDPGVPPRRGLGPLAARRPHGPASASSVGAPAHPRRRPAELPLFARTIRHARRRPSGVGPRKRRRTEYPMETAEIRRRFLSFFESKGHTIVPSVTAGVRRPQPAVRQRRHGAVQALLPRPADAPVGPRHVACRSASAPVTSRRSARPRGTARSSR